MLNWPMVVIYAASLTVPAAFGNHDNCKPRAEMLAQLASLYGERLVSHGIADGGGSVMEVTASKDGDTWSVIVTDPARTCVVLYGYGFEQIDAGRSL